MNQYFSANSLHIDGRCLLDVAPRVPLLATYGAENFINTIDPATGTQTQYQLQHNEVFKVMALAPDGSHCLFAQGTNILKYDFQSKILEKMNENVGNGDVKVLKYAESGGFLIVGSEDGKTVILEPRTGRKEKCRPGHSQAAVNIFLSSDEMFLGSIGLDQNVLVYRLSAVQQPQQVARYQISHLQDCSKLSGAFHITKNIIFLPGQRYLQRLQLLDGRWQMIRCQIITHGQNVILLTQSIKQNTLVTSSNQEVCIWNTRTEQKLFEIEQFSLNTIVVTTGTFFGMRDTDGQLYKYKREIKEHQPMEIEEEKQQDRIQFEEGEGQQAGQQEQSKKSQVVQYHAQKKSKADKIITCLPQDKITSATSMFEQQRFLFVNQHGCVIERLEADKESLIEVEFGHQNGKKMIIARNRPMEHFDINPFAVVYATEKEFGLKILPSTEGQSWESTLNNIRAVTVGSGWVAVATEEQIKLFDMCCHELRSISFDREIIAMRAHENLLCVVYHQSVPIWGQQQLAMQLILVNSSMRATNMLTTTQVPIKTGSVLMAINFSEEGMLFSQDSLGTLRAFSLERGDWTPVSLVGLEDSRKAWFIGVSNQQLIYWKTSNEDPQPTVAPRFSIKTSGFYIPTIGTYPENSQEAYEKLLWARFALDHQKARSRLWGRLKVSRPATSVFYYSVSSIMTEKEIAVRHEQLDQKFFSLIQTYLKSDEPLKAFYMTKTCIRSIDQTKKLVELFDYFNKRSLAIQLEEYCDERQKQLDYEQMQIFQFIKMRETAEKTVKPRSDDPMSKGPLKKIAQSIPSFSQNMSQQSMDGARSVMKIAGSQASMQSQESVPSQLEAENPFLKKKSANEQFEQKKKEISDNVEKYGIKKKVDDKNGLKRGKA